MNKEFTPRTFSETVEALCKVRGEPFLRSGKVNQAYLASITGVSQPSICRWLNNQVSPSLDAVAKLCGAFNVNTSQILGETPIPRLDVKALKDLNSKEDEEFIAQFIAMPKELRAIIRAQASASIKPLQELLQDHNSQPPKNTAA